MSRVLVRPQALRDLTNIIDHIAVDSPQAALRFVTQAEESFELLSRMPEIGASWPTTNRDLAGLRFWTLRRFNKYVVFYKPRSDGIDVVRVLHGAQDLGGVLKDT